MNVFLGVYEPRANNQHLWDMETDVYIHNAKIANEVAMGTDTLPRTVRAMVAAIAGPWWHTEVVKFKQAVLRNGAASLPDTVSRYVMAARRGSRCEVCGVVCRVLGVEVLLVW